MIDRMMNAIVDQMCEQNIIKSDVREHYLYALLTMTEKAITVLTILGIAFVSRRLIQTMFFLIYFFALRRRTGGYHASKFWQCYIGTVMTYVLVIVTDEYMIKYMYVVYVLVAVACVIISVVGSVNHPNMDFNELELQESKECARYVLGLECLILMAFEKLCISEMCVLYMSEAIILSAFLLLLAKIIGQEVRTNEQ